MRLSSAVGKQFPEPIPTMIVEGIVEGIMFQESLVYWRLEPYL